MNALKSFLIGIGHGFRNFSHVVTDVVNFVLLFFVYAIGIGLVAIISKLLDKHFLDIKSNGSSWVNKDSKKKSIEEYYRTF